MKKMLSFLFPGSVFTISGSELYLRCSLRDFGFGLTVLNLETGELSYMENTTEVIEIENAILDFLGNKKFYSYYNLSPADIFEFRWEDGIYMKTTENSSVNLATGVIVINKYCSKDVTVLDAIITCR